MKESAMEHKGEVKQSELDRLVSLIEEYRNGNRYVEMLRYIASFRNLSPYNAFLVVQQRPGCRFVMAAYEWSRYGRSIRRHSRPMVILMPFGPVQFVFDISDTEKNPEKPDDMYGGMDDDDLIEILSAPYRTAGNTPSVELKELKRHLAMFGIRTQYFRTGSLFAAQIEYVSRPTLDDYIDVMVRSDVSVVWRANYLISIREKAETGEEFASICHELGHLFCGHLKLPPEVRATLWRGETLPHNAQEFEAESVAWLVCEHFGVYNPSERYLAGYVGKNSLIPAKVSMERIFYAANLIIRLCMGKFEYRQGWLYKHVGGFREEVKKEINKRALTR